jgi:hypothetical protein
MLEQSKSPFPPKLSGPIRSHAIRADGRKEAFEFVLQVDANVERVADRLREKEGSVRKDPSAGAPYMQPGASPRIYVDGYIAALRDALNLLTRGTEPNATPGTAGLESSTRQEQPDAAEPASPLPEAQRTIQREIALAGGRSDAFAFALTCEGNLAVFVSELRRAEREIPPADAGGEGPPWPGGRDRVYQEAYVAALREAIELIVRITGQHPPEGIA